MFEKIKKNRKTLSENRQKFLTSVLQDNQFVSIKILPFGESWNNIEKEIRSILQCPDYFDRDFESLQKIYETVDGSKINKLKETITAIRNGDRDAEHKTFANHLRSLSPESITNLMSWLPADNLEITYGPDSQRLQEGSPGQKNATLLAFILSYGEEPLLLDQPEDDLDNELISDLIVQQLRQTKTKRQVIVVTHNANIVVNGMLKWYCLSRSRLRKVKLKLKCNILQVFNEEKLGSQYATFLKAEKKHLNNVINVFISEISYVSQSNRTH